MRTRHERLAYCPVNNVTELLQIFWYKPKLDWKVRLYGSVFLNPACKDQWHCHLHRRLTRHPPVHRGALRQQVFGAVSCEPSVVQYEQKVAL